MTKILVVGASGILGRALLVELTGRRVVGTTRSSAKLETIAALGAEPVLVDVFDPGALDRVAQAAAPEIVVNLLTDLAAGPGPANNRVRSEGGPIVIAAARASGARRLVVESVAFELPGAGGDAVRALEADALGSGIPALVLRFGLFWGPGTWHDAPPKPPRVHIHEAARQAVPLIAADVTGVRTIVDPNGIS